MSYNSAESSKQQAQFMAWGMPIIYVATAAVVFAAFIPHFRANAAYLKAHVNGYVGKLSLFAAINIICSVFLFWSPAIHYSLINFLLNFMVLCTISIPSFPKDFSKTFALVFFIWMMIYTGVAPVKTGFEGIMWALSQSNCNIYYKSEATVIPKICKDGWVTFTVFCAIITIGLTFLANLLLISVATDPSVQEEQSDAINGNDAGANAANPYENQGSYQQPAVAGANGEYQSYQNPDNQVA